MPEDIPDLTLPAPTDGNPDAFALIVHVWHLDTLDDLSAACGNFPADADRFLTFADTLSPEDRQRISDRFEGAQLVPVQNLGQDVGALMQLMDQVDLGRYGFVCKIHSKKGLKMPEAWRRTLLGGVLGSRRQVDQIIAGFRGDPQVMLAGARQLFLYGPAYLWKNADGIDGGTVLLSDQRDGDALPQRVTGFPATMSRERIPTTDTMTELEAARRRQRSRTVPKRRRVAVFASYSGDGVLPPQVQPYLEGLRPLVERMEARHLDFWGATDSQEFHPHLQSFFVVLGWHVFQSPVFRNFIEGITKQPNVQQVIMKYEIGLSKTLAGAGYSWGAMVENRLEGVHPLDPTYRNIVEHPITAMEMGLPLVKAKALRQTQSNAEGPDRTLDWLCQNAPKVHQTAMRDLNIARFQDTGRIGFSMIMPTHNRAWCISEAIGSALRQTHQNFELIIVDDGSDDDTGEVIRRDFGVQLDSGTIRYVKLAESTGVCAARNIGIAHARHEWITYLDSDNQLRPNFLTVIANAIIQQPEKDCFYGRIINRSTGLIVGRGFVRKDILWGNYIDLGVFAHRKSLIQRFGGFDPDLRRLVDWDLIIRFTAHQEPCFIPQVFLDYSDDEEGQSADRISVRESFLRANVAVHSKHSPRPTVSTAILSYNHQEFIVEAIESALEQRGDYTHEILLADDGSSDGTARIMARYAARYPNRIRNISTGGNLGVSANYQHCFREAAGNHIAILEGDDYWTDPDKNARQADFLASRGPPAAGAGNADRPPDRPRCRAGGDPARHAGHDEPRHAAGTAERPPEGRAAAAQRRGRGHAPVAGPDPQGGRGAAPSAGRPAPGFPVQHLMAGQRTGPRSGPSGPAPLIAPSHPAAARPGEGA